MRRPRAAPTGREALLEEGWQRLGLDGGLLLHGPAGIGKSVVLDALAARAADAGATVLRCSPAPADTALPYLGVIDLFARVPEDVVRALPSGPRTALRTALLRGHGPVGPYGGLAVRLAVLEALRLLAARAPVVLVVDGLQWLDAPSTEVLAFAARRLDGADVRIAATERVAGDGPPARARCCPAGAAQVPVPPLDDDDVTLLLLAAGVTLPPSALRGVLHAAAGNPLYALALGRDALRAGGPPVSDGHLPVPPELRALVLDRVRALPEPDRSVLLLAASAARPTLALLRSAAGTDATAAALDAAERCGAVSCDASGTVRFCHPLLPAALCADASGPARRRAHALLAGTVGDPVDAARHLALAHPQEDEATARGVMAAARTARERGDAATAAELAALAAGRTPADRVEAHDRRLLAAAGFACDAGHREESERIAQSVLDTSASAPGRVAARLVLLRNAGQALRAKGPLITDGLREAAGDRALEAKLYDWAALRGLLCGELAQAAEHALLAAGRAAAVGDTGTEVDALSTLARVRALTGEPAAAEAALDQALARADHGPRSWGIQRMRAILTLDSDRVASAREQVLALLDATGGAADVEQDVASLVALTRVQVRAGECREALRTAEHCARVVAEAGLVSAPALYAAALAATFGGDTQDACRLAREAVAASEADGDQLFLLRALAALGQAELFAGDRRRAARAVEPLRRALEIGAAMGAADPPLLCWHADLAEALVTAGETDAAATVLGQARACVTGPVPGSVLASLERTEGLLAAATGHAKEGAVRLRSSAQRLRRLELPVELVRTLTALGAVERRARHRTAARAALTEALEWAERTGAVPLAARAGDELARVGAVARGAASGVSLTPAETRVAELVRGGATNREVAAELFISVKTVEGTLSRLYRKFGVRSRTELAHVMASTAARPQ
ncbi:putative LuxR family transcriptional regulator [Actinacidiphila reveromycinica]|uniref:Putative LuxR family transcriptional regulator n=1 Tax=Actinacidiphila reveromycinica TaxID=659352 RepID=A0A7U3UZE6_9ACTN|nr:putative LuxR family transcriptional regulator [Streptomyces sp. SN-593]